MDFRETAEQTMLREAVAKIAADYGHDYFLAKAKAGEKTTELWRAVGEAGFVGVNLPEEYGGGGMGISELAIVSEELAAHGCPLLLMMVSPAICGTLLARFGTAGAAASAGCRRSPAGERKMVFAITEPDAGSNSHKLATVATRDGDGCRLTARKYYISGVDEADAVLVVSRTGVDEDTGRGQLSLFVVDTDAPGLDRTLIPSGGQRPREAVHPVLRRRAGRRPTGCWATRTRACARSSPASTPSASSAPPPATASPATPWPRRPPTPTSARSGACPSAPTRAWPTRWPRPRSRSSWPG